MTLMLLFRSLCCGFLYFLQPLFKNTTVGQFSDSECELLLLGFALVYFCSVPMYFMTLSMQWFLDQLLKKKSIKGKQVLKYNMADEMQKPTIFHYTELEKKTAPETQLM